MRPVTKAQQRVLDRWCAHIADFGCPPTYRAVMADMGFTSSNSVNCHLVALERKGFLRRSDGTWVPTEAGWVAAGWRPPAFERIEPLVPATTDAPACEGEVTP